MDIKKEALNFLSKGNVKQCIKLLIEFSIDEDKEDLHGKIIQISSRYSRIEEMFMKNIIHDDSYTLEVNNIINALIVYVQADSKVKNEKKYSIRKK